MSTMSDVKDMLLKSNDKAVLLSSVELEKSLCMSKDSIEELVTGLPYLKISEKGRKKWYFVDDVAKVISDRMRY